MSDAVTYAIEVGVGLACLAGAVAVRRTRRRWLAALLLLAGAAAIAHGILALAT